MTTKGIINAMAESIPFLMKTNDSPEETQVLKMCDEDGNYVYLWPDEDGEGKQSNLNRARRKYRRQRTDSRKDWQ